MKKRPSSGEKETEQPQRSVHGGKGKEQEEWGGMKYAKIRSECNTEGVIDDELLTDLLRNYWIIWFTG